MWKLMCGKEYDVTIEREINWKKNKNMFPWLNEIFTTFSMCLFYFGLDGNVYSRSRHILVPVRKVYVSVSGCGGLFIFTFFLFLFFIVLLLEFLFFLFNFIWNNVRKRAIVLIYISWLFWKTIEPSCCVVCSNYGLLMYGKISKFLFVCITNTDNPYKR